MAITTTTISRAAGWARTDAIGQMGEALSYLEWHGGAISGLVTFTTYSGGGTVGSSSSDYYCVNQTSTDGSGTARALTLDVLGNLNVKVASDSTLAQHDAAVVSKGVQVLYEAKDIDGSNLPNDVGEGEAIRPAASLYGTQLTTIVSENGRVTPIGLDNQPYSGCFINVGGEYNSSAPTYSDGDNSVLQTNLNGRLLTSSIANLHAADGTAITETSGYLDVCLQTGGIVGTHGLGVSASGFSILAEAKDFDGSALPSSGTAVAQGEGTRLSASLNGVQYVMLVNEDGSKSPIDQTSGQVVTTHSITGGGQGKKVTTGAGNHIVLGGDVDCKKIDIQAQTDNTGLIAVGFNTVDATEATGDGIILYAGDTYSLEVTNLNLIYIDSTVTGDGVRYTYYT